VHDKTSIAIIGAGISGLTLAASLSRAGIRYQLFEQALALTEVGAGIQVAPNAVRLLRELGVGQRLSAVGVRPSAIEIRRSDDVAIGRTTLGSECEELYGAPYYTFHRADLHRTLLDGLGDGRLHLGMRCVGITETVDDVVLDFADGQSVRADVVVGADGIHSVVREHLAQDEPVFSGQTIYRGLVPADLLPALAANPRVLLWIGPEQHVVCYPIASGKLVSFGATTPAGDWRLESWSARGEVGDLLAAYTGWHEATRSVLAAATQVSRWALHDREPLARWSSARVTVVGDAAHPMLPFLAQGANQGIEDAVALAMCLAEDEDVAAALDRYERVRKPRTRMIQEGSRARSTEFHLSDEAEQRERDLRIAGASTLRAMGWLYGYDVRAELR
jgi:salicylate hydroxylase